MKTAIGVCVLLVGSTMLLVGPRLARHRVALHFSTEDLRATSGSRYRRVRATTIAGYVGNSAIAVFWIYLGIRFLTA